MPPSTKQGRIAKPKRTSTRKLTPGPSETNPPTQLPLVESTNALFVDEFKALYLPEETAETNQANQAIQNNSHNNEHNTTYNYSINFYTASSLPPADFEACFGLIEETSSETYRVSSIGWSPIAKKKEMKLPDMRYLVIRVSPSSSSSSSIDQDRKDDGTGTGTGKESIAAFLSFMVTYEDGKEVIYCYEVHVKPPFQRQGLGRKLLLWFEEIGRRIGLEKVMLTCFVSNQLALRVYESLGYGVDEFSPRARRLRSGVVREPDYRIMSKGLR